MDLKEKYGIDVDQEAIRDSIRKACLKVRVNDVLFFVPFCQIESFLKMALSSKNDIEILSKENTDLILV